MQDKIGDDADDAAGDDAGNDQDGEVSEHLEAGDKKGRHQDLAEIVKDAATDGNTGHGKEAGFFREQHHGETEQSAGKRIEAAEQPGEEKACDDYADHVDREGVTRPQIIKGDDDHQIGDAELDSGDAEIKWNQDLDVGKDQSKSREKRAVGQALGAGSPDCLSG